MATIASLVVNMTANSAGLIRDLDRATAANRRFARRNQGIFGGLAASLGSFRNILVGLAAGAGAGGLTRLSDTFTNINNLLRASGFEAQELADAYQRVSDIAIRTRSDIDATGRLYALLNRNAESLGATQEQIATVTTAVQQAFALAGASTQEAAGATRQLSQALASGVLRGQELNSVMEQAPLIARAIADNLGIGLGELRELAAEGRITSEVVFQALLNDSARFNTQFQATTTTFGQLGNILETRVAPIFGEIGARLLPAAVAATNGLATAFQFLSNNLDGIIVTVRALIGLLVGRLITRAIPAMIAGMNALRVSIVTGTIATRGFALALGALGGPLGVVIQAVTILASVFSEQFVEAFRVGINFVIRAINGLITRLDGLLQFFGGDGITFRMAEFTATTMDAAVALDDLGDMTGAINDNFVDLSNTLSNDVAPELSSFQSTIANALDTTARMSELGSQTFDSLSDSLTDFFTTGMLNLRNFADEFIRTFIRIQIRATLANAFGGSFGGFRQNGGPVAAGQSYVVGEAGPELFTPNTSGVITPNGGGGGGAVNNVTYNINATDARSFQQLVAQDPSFIHNVAQRGARSQGGLRR